MSASPKWNDRAASVLVLALTGCGPHYSWDCAERGGVAADQVITDAEDLEQFRGAARLCGGLRISGNVESLEALSDLESLEGSLVIEASAIPSLEALAQLRQVEGHVGIQANPQLATIELPNLEIVGGELAVTDNAALDSLRLPALTSVGLAFYVAGNPVLVDFEPTAALTEARSIDVTQNAMLGTYQVPPKLESLEDLLIAENPALIEISGGDTLAEIGEIIISQNEALELVDLRIPGEVGQFGVASNPSLMSITTFAATSTIETLIVADNDSLTELPAFTAPREMGTFVVEGNDSLLTIARDPNLVSLAVLLVIHNSMLAPDHVTEVFTGVTVNVSKIDGNAGQPVPHVDQCPWSEDGICDAEATESGFPGTGLCVTDPSDCLL